MSGSLSRGSFLSRGHFLSRGSSHFLIAPGVVKFGNNTNTQYGNTRRKQSNLYLFKEGSIIC